MNYRKINLWSFGLLNLLWVLLTVLTFSYLIIIEIAKYTPNDISILLFVYFISTIQIYAFLKLRKGNIYPAIIGILLLSFIIDLDGLKSINILLMNIDILYNANGDFIFDFKLLQGPNSIFNMRLSDFQFNQIGFNAVGLIQIFLLYKQKAESDKMDIGIEAKSNGID